MSRKLLILAIGFAIWFVPAGVLWGMGIRELTKRTDYAKI